MAASSPKIDCECPRRLGAAETSGAFVIRAEYVTHYPKIIIFDIISVQLGL